MPDLVGQQLGNYRLVRLIGHGGFAEVYLGEHIYLGTRAAIKVLLLQLGNDERNDFLEEARTIAHLVHPHVVRVLDFGVQGNTPFLVMDYAPNGSLRQRHMKGERLPLATILPYVKQVSSALQYAHDQNLIHRDVKPGNMLVGAHDEILLSDFGTALVAQSSLSQSTQDTIGTIAYMAPEQIQGKPRAASDQYSLAIVVYEWLSGDRPFHGSLAELVTQQLVTQPPSLHDQIPSISRELDEAIMMALSKDYHQRFATIEAFANALEQSDKDQPSFGVLRPLTPSQPAQPFNQSPSQDQSRSIPPTQPAMYLPNSQMQSPSMQSAMAPQQLVMKPQASQNPPSAHRFGLRTSKKDRIYPEQPKQQTKKESSGGARQLLAMVLGLLIYGGISYYIDRLDLHGNPLAFRLYYAAIVIPLFFGVVFGPWFGVISAVGGYLLGHYLAGTPSLWNNIFGIAITGFIAGLAMFKTRGNYNSIRNIAIAELFAGMGIIVGEGFIDCSNIQLIHTSVINSAADFFTFAFFELLIGLILLPLLLTIYAKLFNRGR